MEELVKSSLFDKFGLDDRLLEAIARLRWKNTTLIQEQAIPMVLKGRDILAKARTGTGKTGAFVVPIIQKLLDDKFKDKKQVIKTLILVPTKELCNQTVTLLEKLTCLCTREVRCVNAAFHSNLEAQRPLLSDNPDIVIGTPSRIKKLLEQQYLDIKESLQYLVIDEADLMFTFDYADDLNYIISKIPKLCQKFITSATLECDSEEFKSLSLRNPVILKLKEPPLPSESRLSHYVMKVNELDKAVMLYALFKLNMMRGKTIIFVNTVNKGFKLRLFLSQFGIKSCILNSHLPVNSRCNIVDQFNVGKYHILITSDEYEKDNAPRYSKRMRDRDPESGVCRGIDFQFVSNVVNFDFPVSVASYIHHVGRTARGDSEGTAISFISIGEFRIFKEVEKGLINLYKKSNQKHEKIFQDFKFDMQALDGFKYRASDVWTKCTTNAIKDIRRMEIKNEILNSTKLHSFFKKHPKDLEVIKHDIKAKPIKGQPHLKNVPEYNIPSKLKKYSTVVPKSTKSGDYKRKRGHSSGSRPKDSLKTMKFDGFMGMK